ncbi:hypothetical protein QBC43DRAFT_42572 [Cladorrhinum sp. PSN259]|nr:hypothetical protein QBC43DRAFT_42572 [Cladorrhinum sp. PSN259]
MPIRSPPSAVVVPVLSTGPIWGNGRCLNNRTALSEPGHYYHHNHDSNVADGCVGVTDAVSPPRSPRIRQGRLEDFDDKVHSCTAGTRPLLVHPRECQRTVRAGKLAPTTLEDIQCDLSEALAQQPCRWHPAGWLKRRDQDRTGLVGSGGGTGTDAPQQLETGPNSSNEVPVVCSAIPVSLRSFPIRLVAHQQPLLTLKMLTHVLPQEYPWPFANAAATLPPPPQARQKSWFRIYKFL